jgi:hypothetical protein
MRKRPLGVAVLSAVAFLLCPFSTIFALSLLWQSLTIRNQEIPELVAVASVILLLMLAWVSYVAGCDLWNLRSRGRGLVILAAAIVFLYGAGVCFIAGVFGQIELKQRIQLLGGAICFLGAICLVYMSLPSVRTKFRTALFRE